MLRDELEVCNTRKQTLLLSFPVFFFSIIVTERNVLLHVVYASRVAYNKFKNKNKYRNLTIEQQDITGDPVQQIM